MSKAIGYVLLAFLVISMLFVIIATFMPKNETPEVSQPDDKAIDTTNYDDSSSAGTGENGYLAVEGETFVWVSRTKEAQDLLTKACNAKDTYGVAELLSSGQVVSVSKNTKVLVLGQEGIFLTKIRILEGNHAYKAGVVPFEFVRKNPMP